MTNIYDERHFELTVNGERRKLLMSTRVRACLACFETGSALLVRKVRAKRVSVVRVQFFSMATSCAPAWCSRVRNPVVGCDR